MTNTTDRTICDPALAAQYKAAGWWDHQTLAQRIDALASTRPNDSAFITQSRHFSWADYANLSRVIAGDLLHAGLKPRARVAVLLPDGLAVHAALMGCERAGMIAVGIGARAGDAEIAHLLQRTNATALITYESYRSRKLGDLIAALAARGAEIAHVLALPPDDDQLLAKAQSGPAPTCGTSIGPDDLFLINSTSGTTGLPKCVMHNQNRWFYFHKLAAEAADFQSDDVFMSVVPAPFGFGLWTSHFTPALQGCPTVIMERFDASAALDLIAREKVTVLGCVSTQFIMMLDAQARQPRNLTSLRAMFTGGEAVPYARAADFENVTGAKVLQFYGSNETGALSRTKTRDDRERRLRSAGKIIDEMHVRLFDPETGEDVTNKSDTGQPGCRGPATCLGYWDDETANEKLFTQSGHMLMGDIVTIDKEGYLQVVGRTSDFIIRGGKNISAPAIEGEVATHPAVSLAAAVPVPDPIFGERVCIYVTVHPGMSVSLKEITDHLNTRGVSKEWFPEHLAVMDELPRSSGGKIAKARLKEDAKKRWALPC